MSLDLRLKAYLPNGASQGVLPAPDSFSLAVPLNDTPSLSINHGVKSPRGGLLGQPLEFAVETSSDGGETWTEPPDCRFLYLRDERDPVRTADTWVIEAPGYIWRIQKAKVLAEGLTDADGRRTFTDQTVGHIFGTFWAEAQARGALDGMALSGSAAQDASGAAWGQTLTRSYDLGTDLLTVLMDLAAAGYLDFRTVGRTVAIYKPDTVLAVDRTVTASQVHLTPLGVTEAPFRRTWEGLADFIQVAGDEGSSVGISNPVALKPWGRWEDYVTQGGVSDEGTLTAIGQRYQALTEAARSEFTHALSTAKGPAPLVDFWTGDYVWSRSLEGEVTRYRVRQITLQKEGNSVRGNVVVNDRFLESDIRTRRMLDAILGGASSGGSTGPPPTPPGPDILAPAKVIGLTGSSASYVDGQGAPRAQVSLDWSDVTTNADGTPASDVTRYQIAARRTSAPIQATGAIVATVEGASAWHHSPYEMGSTWAFAVRAVDASGNEGAWSDFISVTMSYDTTPPLQTSTPTGVQRFGTAQWTWDGKSHLGGAMDADLAYVELHVSTVSGFTAVAHDPATQRAVWRGAETAVISGLVYGTTYYAVLIPFDTSGNQGPQSAQATVQVKLLVDVANFPDFDMEQLTVRVANFLTVNTDMLNANAAAIGLLDTGVLTAAVVQTQTNPSGTGGGLWDSSGFFMYPVGGGTPYLTATKYGVTVRGNITASTINGGSLVTGSTVQTGSSGARVVMSALANPAEGGSSWGLLEFYNNLGWNPGRIWGSESGGEGVLRIHSPYNGLSTATDQAAAITLISSPTGARRMNLYAGQMEFTAKTYLFTSHDGTSVDLRMNGSYQSTFAFVDQAVNGTGVGRFKFEFWGGGNFAHLISSENQNNGRQGLVIKGSALGFNFGTGTGANTSFIVADNNSAIPQLRGGSGFIALSFISDILRVTTWASDVLQPIAASSFTSPSDSRDKTNPTKVEGALDDLRALDFYDYDTPHGLPLTSKEHAKALRSKNLGSVRFRQRGVMAQDFAKRVRHGTYLDDADSGMWSLDLYAFAATIGAATKELDSDVTELARRVAALERAS